MKYRFCEIYLINDETKIGVYRQYVESEKIIDEEFIYFDSESFGDFDKSKYESMLLEFINRRRSSGKMPVLIKTKKFSLINETIDEMENAVEMFVQECIIFNDGKRVGIYREYLDDSGKIIDDEFIYDVPANFDAEAFEKIVIDWIEENRQKEFPDVLYMKNFQIDENEKQEKP